jgi:hypothetical protein
VGHHLPLPHPELIDVQYIEHAGNDCIGKNLAERLANSGKSITFAPALVPSRPRKALDD